MVPKPRRHIIKEKMKSQTMIFAQNLVRIIKRNLQKTL